MGGSGSTRWNGTPTRRQADGSFRLPAPPAWMVEARAGLWRWQKFGYFVRFDLDGPAEALLRYPTRRGAARQSVGLESTPANLGGSRWWWLCPDCDRRCGKLYLPPRSDLFACRLCHALSYESAQASRAGYYATFKSLARQCPKIRPGFRIGRATATDLREVIRERIGGFTVAPYAGIPEALK